MGKKARERKIRVIERRRSILRIITQNPGIHLRELERTSGMGLGALRNLLDSLISQKLVALDEVDGLRTLFPTTGIDSLNRKPIALLRKQHLRSIVELLLSAESLTHRELQLHMGIPRTTLRGHVDVLKRAGIVSTELNISLIDPGMIEQILLLTEPRYIDRLVSAVIEIFDLIN